MKSILFCLLGGVALLLAPACRPEVAAPRQPAVDAHWWVAVEGDDAAAGSRSAPFRTVARAVASATAGETIQLGPGVFRESVVMTKSGAEGAPIIIRGTLGDNGQWLTRVTSGRALDPAAWEAAGGGLLRNTEVAAPVFALTWGERRVAALHDRAGHVKNGAPRLYSAWEVLAWPEGHRLKARYDEDGLDFWKTIGGVYHFGQRPGSTTGPALYLRLAGVAGPEPLALEAYRAGATIALDQASHIVLRDLEIAGGEVGIAIRGENARHNEVDHCRILFATDRVLIQKRASRNVIRNCRIELCFLGHPTGAWAGGKGNAADASAKSFVYNYFKYWASSHGTSDDRSITLENSSHNRITGNTLDGGLIGIAIRESHDILVERNRVARHSSVGTSMRANCTGIRYENNHFEDNSINFRAHAINVGNQRDIVLSRNVSVLPEGVGNHLFFHVFRDKEPLTAQSAPAIRIVHNAFIGGNSALRLPAVSHRPEGFPEVLVLNNLIAVGGAPVWGAAPEKADVLGAFDYNLIVRNPATPESLPRGAGPHNRVIIAGLPEALREAGLDISVPFSAGGKTWEAISGFAPGYFKGAQPGIGPWQGEEIPALEDL